MRHRTELPRRLGERFTVKAAEAAGVRQGRYDAADLHRPFHGVRSIVPVQTLQELVESCALRLRPGQAFVGLTAARAWGLPLPAVWTPAELLEVVAPTGTTPPHTKGVHGRKLRPDRYEVRILRGVPVVDPVAAFFSCAVELTIDDAVVVIDALVTEAFNYPGLGPGRPMNSLAGIRRRLDEWGRFPGSGTIRAALPLARERVESPKETETRLRLIEAGLPEPVVQWEERVAGRLIARIDLAYPELKIAIEYDGDGHRTDRTQWRRDIQRRRELEDAGWVFVHLTHDDLTGPGLRAVIARIRRLIVERTA